MTHVFLQTSQVFFCFFFSSSYCWFITGISVVIHDICLFAIIPGTVFFYFFIYLFIFPYCWFTIGILSGDSWHMFFCHFAYSYQVIDVLMEIDRLSQPPELRRLLTANHTISRYVLEISVCLENNFPVMLTANHTIIRYVLEISVCLENNFPVMF